ncbi:hypothetical protein J7E81_18765 [Bacillus sp. ISL-18]|uniref:hypothetical protein n=1 Tax=Bacillus sp. ISL-18 TaxID=2819118 RepID=UPI001BEA9E5C|nr:hypothetical protein [Bacillus sp. ISL-18]MBT2657243.1 hypothetical protein [Bacillus sp. ISL-18]
MNWEPIPSPNDEIRDIKKTIIDTRVHVQWYWPNGIDFVYIQQTPADQGQSQKEFEPHFLKLYTREEYKANQGLFFNLETMGQIVIRIFPGKKVDGHLIVFRQNNDQNRININGSRAKVYFSITYKQKLFQTLRKVKMSITTEIPISKEQLVYVKKRGSVPLSLEDGTIYPFIRDIVPGKTILPEIEINKHEFIQIFLNKGNDAAQPFELIPV